MVPRRTVAKRNGETSPSHSSHEDHSHMGASSYTATLDAHATKTVSSRRKQKAPAWKPAFSAKYAADGSLITGTDKKAGIKSENSIEVEKRKAPKVDVDTAAAVLGDSMPAEEQHETTKEASSDGVSVGAGPYPAAAFEDISLRGETETEVDDGDWEHVDRRLVADNDKNCQTTAKSSVVSAIYGWFSRKG